MLFHNDVETGSKTPQYILDQLLNYPMTIRLGTWWWGGYSKVSL